MRPFAYFSRHLGFSLLELSVVLVVISLIAGGGMSMAGGALKAADRVKTQERLNTLKIALDSYAKTYGYLPCPADRTQTPSSATFGRESRWLTACSPVAGVVNLGTVFIGAVPVRTLGLPDTYAADGWDNKLTYAVTSFLAEEAKSYPSRNGEIAIQAGVKSGTWYNVANRRMSTTVTSAADNGAGLARLTYVSAGNLANGMIVYVNGAVYKGSYTVSGVTPTTMDLVGSTYTTTDVGQVAWQEPATNVAYVVVSHGPDGRGAYPLNSAGVPSTKSCNDGITASITSPAPCPLGTNTACNDIENCNDDITFFDTTYNDSNVPAQYFDDYIVWGSNALMREPVNPIFYPTLLYPACPAGTCELWCAKCELNFPGGSGTAPPPAITGSPALCKKVITSNTSNCKASCFWSGDTASGYQKCP